MNVPGLLRAACALALVASLHACRGDEPGEEPPPAGPTGEAAPPPMEAPALATGHTPDAAVLPEGHPDPMSGRGASGIVWKTPVGWVEETPSSSMRRGQYRVPGPGGDARSRSLFGAGQGGDAAATRSAGPAVPAARRR